MNILNILNYNSDLIKDKQNADEIINFINNLKTNLNNSNYIVYQNFINKISKFINMILPNFKKELKESSNSNESYFDSNDEKNNLDDEDNISIDSISEYEYDADTTEAEELEIMNFEETMSIKFINTLNNFDFEYEKLY